MIPGQPGKREIRERAFDKKVAVYRFDPVLETAMQWEIIGVFDAIEPARAFAFPRLKLAA